MFIVEYSQKTKDCKMSKHQGVINELNQFKSTHQWDITQVWKARSTRMGDDNVPKTQYWKGKEIFYVVCMFKQIFFGNMHKRFKT